MTDFICFKCNSKIQTKPWGKTHIEVKCRCPHEADFLRTDNDNDVIKRFLTQFNLNAPNNPLEEPEPKLEPKSEPKHVFVRNRKNWKMFSTSYEIESEIKGKGNILGPFWCDTYFGKTRYLDRHNGSELSTKILFNKYENSEAASSFLAQKISNLIMDISDFPKFDMIIPVPNLLNENNDVVNSKAVSIGFDLSDLLNIHCSVDVLIKTQDRVKTQGMGERLASVNRSYFINNNLPIKDKRIILVDDVLTTGATTQKCATLLLENGANQVIIICVGRNYYA